MNPEVESESLLKERRCSIQVYGISKSFLSSPERDDTYMKMTWTSPNQLELKSNHLEPRASAQATQRHFHQNDPIHPYTYVLFFRHLPAAQVLHPSNLFGQLPQLLLAVPPCIKWMTGLKSTISSIKWRRVPGTRISVGPSFPAHSWVHSRKFGSCGSSTEVAGDGDGMAGQRMMGGVAADKLREPTRILSEELQKPTLKLPEEKYMQILQQPTNLQIFEDILSSIKLHSIVMTTIHLSNHPTIQPYPTTGLLNLIQQLGRLRPFVARALQCRTIRMEFHQLSHQLHRRLPAIICWVW